MINFYSNKEQNIKLLWNSHEYNHYFFSKLGYAKVFLIFLWYYMFYIYSIYKTINTINEHSGSLMILKFYIIYPNGFLAVKIIW